MNTRSLIDALGAGNLAEALDAMRAHLAELEERVVEPFAGKSERRCRLRFSAREQRALRRCKQTVPGKQRNQSCFRQITQGDKRKANDARKKRHVFTCRFFARLAGALGRETPCRLTVSDGAWVRYARRRRRLRVRPCAGS